MAFLLTVWTWVLVVLFFGLAVFIHEFGHFLAAKLLGFRIEVFSIGFGPALWKKKVNGVEYKVSLIPFGGYVALPQLDPSGMDKLQGEADRENIPDVAAWKRIVVAVAGPLGNVVLAVVLAFLIFAVPGVKTGGVGTEIGYISQKSQAYQAGVRVGDKIVSAAGAKVETWNDFILECHLAGKPGDKVSVEVLRGGRIHKLDLELVSRLSNQITLVEGIGPAGVGTIDEVRPGTPADAAGLRKGDKIQAVDGKAVTGSASFVGLMKEVGTKTVVIEVERGTEKLAIPVTPRMDAAEGRPLIGVAVANAVDYVPVWMRYKDPRLQLKGDAESILRVFRAFFAPKTQGEGSRAAKSLGGPVTIFAQLYYTLRDSFMSGLGFLRFLCINLAILNLLPLPVLDGGHILFALFEMIFRRKLPAKMIELLVNGFAIALIGLMVLLVYSDVRRLVPVFGKKEAPVAQEDVGGK